jgi:hypothetical protein
MAWEPEADEQLSFPALDEGLSWHESFMGLPLDPDDESDDVSDERAAA